MLALVIIREECNKIGLGLGPVLMLSYKNHALDEFLCDTIEFSDKKFSHGELIRSGKPENPKLFGFSERNSSTEIDAIKELKQRQSVVRESCKFIRCCDEHARYINVESSEVNFYHTLFSN